MQAIPVAEQLVNAHLLDFPKDLWIYRGPAAFGRGLCEAQEDVLYLNGRRFANEAYTIPVDTLHGLSKEQKEPLFSVMETIIQKGEPYKYPAYYSRLCKPAEAAFVMEKGKLLYIQQSQ